MCGGTALPEDPALTETALTIKCENSSTAGVSEADQNELMTRMSFILQHGAEAGGQTIFEQNTSISS